jgi:ferritin-like metal-binding protein YciE
MPLKLSTPEEAYKTKLGAALTMENEVLKILESNIKSAQDEQVKELFDHHHDETEQHVANIEEAFQALGWDVDKAACPAIEGIRAEGKANATRTDDAIVDTVLLQGAVETEHHEIGVYENLIINARAMDREDVAKILERNIEQEKHTLDEVKSMQEKVAA